MTTKALLKWLHAQRREADKALCAHVKEWGRCFSSCIEGNQLRTKIEVLDEVIEAVGGRP